MNSNLTVETRSGKRTELVLFANVATAMMGVEDTLTVREWEGILPQSFASILQNGVQSSVFRFLS